MLSFTALSLRRGSTLLLEQVDFRVYPGQKIGITGANGCGKSSLFALIRGELGADSGECTLPRDWLLASVRQEVELAPTPAIDYVIDGDEELRRVERRLRAAEADGDGDAISACHERLHAIDGYQAESRAARLLAGLGFAGDEMRRRLDQFSGGWIMRLNLARALMCRSDLLLLDEPTNHLDLDAVIWLERWLEAYRGTLLLISHDRDFLDAVCDGIVHIEQGRATLYRGNYSAFERQRAERLAQRQSAFAKQQQSIAHMQRYIDRFRAKASKARQAQSRVKALEKMQLIAPAHVDSPFHFEFPDPGPMPTQLIKLERVVAGYGGRAVLTQVGLALMPGQRIGLLGLNGAGKSTLIRVLAGELEPMEGELIRARELRIGYFAQHQVEQLDLDSDALTTLRRLEPAIGEREARSYLGGFNFRGDKVRQPVGDYSGGERARLTLALIIRQRPNLLLLDEPTNHLDLEMRLALNRALQGYDGASILVSHDRNLLTSVCDELWLIDQGRLQAFDDDLGAYPAWLAQRKQAPAGTDPGGGGNAYRERKRVKAARARMRRLEAEIERLSVERARLERELADHAVYESARRQHLDDLLLRQRDNSRQLEAAEQDWLELGESIEQDSSFGG